MKEEVMLSICCITYNHEKFIAQALDSFLMQKTNFKFEIVIQDDASIDNTANIIRDYEKKYPNIIKPIYNKENQYSKIGTAAILLKPLKACKGKYIAVCEGDDYWCDKNKLQKQVDYLEENSKCTFTFHNALVLNMSNGKKEKWKNNNKNFVKKDNKYNAGELDLLGFIPTASYVFRKKCIDNIPDFFSKCVVGDRPLKLIVTSYGYAYGFEECMSIYRINIGNSAMDMIHEKCQNIESGMIYWNKMKWLIEQVNKFSDYKYNQYFLKSKDIIELQILLMKKQYFTILKEKKFKEFISKERLLKEYISNSYPKLYRIYKKMKGKF